MSPSPERTASRGASAEPKDNAYVFGIDSFIYTTARAETGFTARHAAVVLLSTHGDPFELTLREGESIRTSVAVVASLVERKLVSPHGHLVSFHVMPPHPLFRYFVGMPAPGVVALDRHAFTPWDHVLSALYDGSANIYTAHRHFEGVVNRALSLFSRHALVSRTQTDQIFDLLQREPEATLDDLAEHLNVSPRWMGRLFQRAMGMSYRDFQSWRKHRKVLEMLYSRRSLTRLAHAAGFSDSPQFNRAFQRWYGQNPSFSRDPNQVRIFTLEASNQPGD